MVRWVAERVLLGLTAVLLAGAWSPVCGQLLYVGNNGDNNISTYVIDENSGLLTEILPRAGLPGSPSSVTVHPSGQFVYVTTTGGPHLVGFSIDPGTGALTQVGDTVLANGSGPQDVVIDPSGSFAYVAHQGGNYVSAFTIDPSSGNLTPVAGSPFSTPPAPTSLVVHPNGKFLYVSAAGTAQIAAFNIGGDGSLTPAAGSPFSARGGLFWMAMDPAGKFLFVAERMDGAVLVYSVDPGSGALTQVGSPVPSGPAVSGVAVDPTGQFLYVSNQGNGSVIAYSIDPTGALTKIAGGPAVAPGAYAVILDPTGKFLYVPAQAANVVQAYSIDPSSGALSSLGQPFFPAGVAPQRGATVLLSPPVLPPIITTSATNFLSHAVPDLPNSGIAQGSRFSISGNNIGPASGVNATFPLQTVLGGASIQIQSGDTTTAALMVSAQNTQVTAVAPSSTPLGPAMVTVTYNGQTSTPLPITIVSSSVGIRSTNQSGTGPALAKNANPDTVLSVDTFAQLGSLPSNALNLSAQPGQMMVVPGTGLGATTLDETQNVGQEENIPADVIVGNKLATVITKLRYQEGGDFFLFKLPDDVPLGCYVPLAIRAGGVTSNVVTISISSTGGSCTDPAGLAASDIDAAQKAKQINIGNIVLGHIDLGPLGPSDFADATFANYNFPALVSAYSLANNGGGIRGSFVTPALGTCAVAAGSPVRPNNPFDTPGDPTPFQFLNVGQALNLNGPPGAVQMPALNYSFNPDGYVITPGNYTVDNGAGNQTFGPFKAAITLPPLATWTNQSGLASVDRTQDLTVTWSGGNPDKEFVMIAGLSASAQAVSGFLCTEKPSAGQFTIPAWVLSSLPASGTLTQGGQTLTTGLLGVGTAPFSSVGRFSAPGLDFAVITYEQATISLVSYQ